jgi:hypothetical protein
MSQNRQITIVHPNGAQKTTVEVPTNIAMERMVPALASRLGLPTVDRGGQAVEYRLARRHEGGEQEQVLNPNDTLASADVQDGDVLRLYADMRAGGCLNTLSAR